MKLGNPFGKGNLCYITQTYHGSSNTAIDCYGTKYIANLPVYAIADGKVGNYYRGGGSYISQYPDNSDLRIWYVHIWHTVPNGSYVKKGQKIGEIAPKSVNGGFSEHLHLGLTPKGKYIMDYFDRSIPFRTRYKDIKASWFKSDGLLNWSKFKDLSYTNTTMAFKKGDKIIFTGEQNIRKGSGTSYAVTGTATVGMIATIEGEPRVADNYTWYDLVDNNWVADVGKFKIYVAPPTPDPTPDCTAQEKEIVRLEGSIKTLTEKIKGLELKLGLCDKKVLDMKASYEAQVENLEDKLLEQELESEEKYESLRSEKDRIAGERNKCQIELSKCEKASPLKELIDKIFDWLKKK